MKTKPRQPEAQRRADTTADIALPGLAEQGALSLESVSVFGSKAETKVKELLLKHKRNRLKAFEEFLWAEAHQRRDTAKGPLEAARWNDASNVFVGAFVCNNMGLMRHGEDLRMVLGDVSDTKRGITVSDASKEETLARVYLAARKRVFPELKTDVPKR